MVKPIRKRMVLKHGRTYKALERAERGAHYPIPETPSMDKELLRLMEKMIDKDEHKPQPVQDSGSSPTYIIQLVLGMIDTKTWWGKLILSIIATCMMILITLATLKTMGLI